MAVLSVPRTPLVRLPSARVVAVLVSLLNAAAFAVWRPGVPDLQAALARAAAAAHGVGLTYWFGWFAGGATPGQYSVATPWLSAWITAPLLGALATVAVTPLVDRALVGTRHHAAGVWVAVVTAGLSLWSGRIAFAVGAACAVGAVWALRRRRIPVAVLAALATAACSPVCAAFLALGLGGVLAVERRWHAAAPLVACAAGLGAIALLFGTPGPEIFRPGTALLISACCLVMLAARPGRVVQLVVAATAVASPVLYLIPNGLGSNLARMSYICLPVAVLATARVRRRVAALLVAPAVLIGGYGAVHDVQVALRPASSAGYYDSLEHELDVTPGLLDHRLQVVQSLSYHAASYALLGHAALATGWETQEQRAVAAVLRSRSLDAASYRSWLAANAVGYVAFDRRSPEPSDPEYALVQHGLRYLTPVWTDATWTLYRVRGATPIVAAPATVLQATQSHMTVWVPCACSLTLRLRWSHFLVADTPGTDVPAGTVTPGGAGWSTLTVPRAGTVVLEGAG